MRQFCETVRAGNGFSDLEEMIGVGDIVLTLYRGRLVKHYRRRD